MGLVLPLHAGLMSWLVATILLCLWVTTGHCQQNPGFASPVANVDTIVGQPAILRCTVKNRADARVSWVKNSIPVSMGGDILLADKDRMSLINTGRQYDLHIQPTVLEDEGTYTCVIYFSSGYNSSSGDLTILVPPTVQSMTVNSQEVRDDQKVVVEEGTDTLFNCTATGKPVPNVIWKKLGEHGKASVFFRNSTVLMANISRTASGRYSCLASNNVSPTDNRVMDFEVHYVPTVIPQRSEVMAVLRGRTSLRCDVDALPAATKLDWYKDNRKISQGQRYESTGGTTGTLILELRDVRDGDFGEYICRVTNSVAVREASVTLYEVATLPPTTPGYSELDVGSGHRLSYTCISLWIVLITLILQ
ncbi:limbic system-associated membrane protein-like [Branchiostoma lanceolatum]|uniref:limbic system-associated membrane protein-like n=1 Tax=Branchiostoma lanceolatum TaxID=7740 RepID=UPI0034523896